MSNDQKLVKIHLDLPVNKEVSGESFWAEDLGDNLYRLRNSPFYAFGLNFYDIVLAVKDTPESLPSIKSIHEFGGHKTLRVIFLDEESDEQRITRLKILNQYKGFHENANGVLFAIDVEPEGDYGKVCDQLYEWELTGILSYETCEGRVSGSFDSE